MIAKKEYMVVYDRKGHTIEAGQNRWIPDKEIAEKIMRNKQSAPIFRDVKLHLNERDCNRELTDCRTLEGKPVLNRDYFYVDALEVGDYVEEAIVDDFMDCLPPACMRRDCSQLGEAHSIRIDENGKGRNTYLTFAFVGDRVWRYCGDCFRGENQIRGKEPIYVKGGQ